MSEAERPKPVQLLRARDREKMPEDSFSHPLNPKSEIRGVSLGDAVGLQRMGVHLVRIAPGRESYTFHSHHGEEEFLFILSGRGIAEVGDGEHEVGPGDFLGFPTPSVGHHMRNPFDVELVYLTGGERHAMEVADYPKLGMRLVRVGMNISLHRTGDSEAFPGFDKVQVPTAT